MSVIADNLAAVNEHIGQLCLKAGRPRESIQLIAVSKTRSVDEVAQAIAAGQRYFGENTLQDAITKIPALEDRNLQWHFIGHLQSKKAGKIPGLFQWVHSIDSIKLARKLSDSMSRSEINIKLNCLLQVNLSGESTKSGLAVNEVKPFIEKLIEHELPGLTWRGLMTIGVQGDESESRRVFAELRRMRDECQQEFGLAEFNQLSMGMSNDYTIAIEEGATLVRIGTAIFGQR